MKIYFSPAYTSRVHISQPMMMDSVICNVPQLVDIIELHSGIHYKEYSQTELCVHYLQALIQMDIENISNVLHESLAKDPLSTAKKCLCWRDQLILAGWNPEMRQSARIEALALAEPHFKIKTLADRIMTLPPLIAKSGIAKHLEIEVQYDENIMHPAVTAIIESLRHNGATISYPMEENIPVDCNLYRISEWMSGAIPMPDIKDMDDSIEILKFKDRKTILRYITAMPEDAICQSLWISNHGADIDRALSRGGKCTSGSAYEDSLPSIVQLLPLGMSMFISPIDINKLVAWLRASRSPLPGVRYSIANIILEEGGWNEKEIDKAIDKYLVNHPEIDEKSIRSALNKFLPIPGKDDEVRAKIFVSFIKNLKEWALEGRRQEHLHEFYCQFDQLIDRISTVQVLIDFHCGETIDADTLSQWVNMACEVDSYEQYSAQCHGPIVINCPADMIGNQERCHWMGFTNYTPAARSYAFLSSSERQSLAKRGCKLYDEDKEMAANRIVGLWPLRHVRHLIVYELENKDPDEIRSVVSQQLLSLTKESRITITKEMNDVPCEEVSYTIDNFGTSDTRYISISKGASMPWRELESYSSVDLLIQHPFEYVMKYGLRLDLLTDDTIKVSNSTGKVAHFLIQSIFAPGRRLEHIREHYKTDYESLLDEALHLKGMILLLPENKIELIRLRNNLRESVERLIDIYEANGFVTVACEEEIRKGLSLAEGHGMLAFLDLHVVDNNGSHVVIDLKWTSNHKMYESRVKEERALQLDIYHAMLAARHAEVKSAYYVMPRNRMYTCFDIKGDSVDHVSIDHNINEVITRLINSYVYRRTQIENGEIEMADGAKLDEFAYGRDCKSGADLYPLEIFQSKKCENKFSDYKCFYN